MALNSVDVSMEQWDNCGGQLQLYIHHVYILQEIADLVRKEPSHVSLEWVLRLLQHYIESDPDQIFIIDLIPSLRYLYSRINFTIPALPLF